jgi:hypothetical protein
MDRNAEVHVRTWRRCAIVALGLAIVVIGGVSIALAGSQGHARPETATSAPAWVGVLAQRIATESGDPTPSSVWAVSTTRGAANRAAGGDTVDSNQPVYLVAMTGTFTDEMASIPKGAPSPAGHMVTFVADAATRQVLDYGIGDARPDLQALGDPVRVPLP